MYLRAADFGMSFEVLEQRSLCGFSVKTKPRSVSTLTTLEDECRKKQYQSHQSNKRSINVGKFGRRKGDV